jgi:hypothetical protein
MGIVDNLKGEKSFKNFIKGASISYEKIPFSLFVSIGPQKANSQHCYTSNLYKFPSNWLSNTGSLTIVQVEE